jgi:hypothetical protein
VVFRGGIESGLRRWIWVCEGKDGKGGWAGGVVNDGSFHMRISRLVCDCLSHNEQPYLHKYTLSLVTALLHVRLAVRVGRLRLNISVARIAMSLNNSLT